jgi:HAD superfamily hydrolase (TIGR01509 family)
MGGLVTAPRAVLFDFAYTLFFPPNPLPILRDAGLAHEDAMALWEDVWRRADAPEALRAGRDLSPTRHRREWIELLRPTEAVAHRLSEVLYEAIFHPSNWVPYRDVADVLSGVQASGLRIGVVSNITYDLRPVMRAHDLDRYIDEYVLSFEIGAEKPRVDVFREACERLGVRPAECLMVGDSPHADGGAARAGMPTLILPGPRATAGPRFSSLEWLTELARCDDEPSLALRG